MNSKHTAIIVILVLVCVLTYTFGTLHRVEAPADIISTSSASFVANGQGAWKNIRSVEANAEKDTLHVVFANGFKTDLSIADDVDLISDFLSAEIVDINFDGSDDIMMVSSMGAYNEYTHFLTFDPSTKKFIEYPFDKTEISEDTPGLAIVNFDKEHKTLTSFFKGRGLSDIYTQETYEFHNGWHKTKEVTQDTVGEYSGYYTRKTSTIENGTSTKEVIQYFKLTSNDSLDDMVEISKAELKKKGLIK
jgi:hypothetical protein